MPIPEIRRRQRRLDVVARGLLDAVTGQQKRPDSMRFGALLYVN
ncbi:hypothetical protein [Sphingopyxis sp.]|jgi:hypothetical protein